MHFSRSSAELSTGALRNIETTRERETKLPEKKRAQPSMGRQQPCFYCLSSLIITTPNQSIEFKSLGRAASAATSAGAMVAAAGATRRARLEGVL